MASVYRRGTAFYAKVKDSAGRWRNVRTSASKRGQALAAAEELQQQLDQGQPLPTGRAVTLTVAALCDRFLTEYTRPRIKDLARYRALAARHLRTLVLPHLGELPVQQLRRAQVERMVAALREAGKAERTVQAALARLSTVFSWAQAQEILDVARNPCAGIERGRLPKVVDHLALQEVQLLLNHQQRLRPAQALVWTMAATVLFSGLRLGELRALRWLDIDGGVINVRWSWTVGRRPKSGKPRQVPLHPELQQLLMEGWRRRCPAPEDEGLVFPVNDGAGAGAERSRVSVRALRRLCGQLGVRVLRPRPWHGLRHTFSRHLDLAVGRNAAVVAALLGHARQGGAATLAYLGGEEGEGAESLAFLAGQLAKLTYKG